MFVDCVDTAITAALKLLSIRIEVQGIAGSEDKAGAYNVLLGRGAM